MAGEFTDRYFTRDSLGLMMTTLSKYYPQFDTLKFGKLINDSQWNSLAIKQKMHHVTLCLHKVLPESFDESVEILLKSAPEINGWESMTLPDYIEMYGQEFWDKSMLALIEFTKHGSSEFAIRPFLINEPEKTTAFLEGLTNDENEEVRRYASEGCRPRHPWAMALPVFKKNPSLILPILEKLKNDESLFVRRSVANNLNDISKDNPDTVLEIAELWYGKNANTDWLVKHACRTLLKAGNRRALGLFGFGSAKNLIVSDFQLDKKSITLGEKITFTYSLEVKAKKETKVRLEYGVYFMKANGKPNRKVFKISEKSYQPGSNMISKKHKFIDLTTRKHYKGTHCISLIVNGEEKEKLAFMLKI
jgi:3-methyladenine DNA glycosylase AlkC